MSCWSAVTALGLDETLFVRTGRYRTQSWCTTVADVSRDRRAMLVEVIESRTAAEVSGWIDAQPERWRAGIDWGVLEMFGPYRRVYDDSRPDAHVLVTTGESVRLTEAATGKGVKPLI